MKTTDCHHLNAKEIINLIIKQNPELCYIENRRKVYIGATSNIAERLYRHNAQKVIFCAKTASQRVAAAVEAEALKMGFNIGNVKHGGNGTNSRSIYIYAYIIDEYSLE